MPIYGEKLEEKEPEDTRTPEEMAATQVTGVTAQVSGKTVVLNWDSADTARYYKIARASGSTGQYYCLKYNVMDTTYTDSGVSAGKYRYKVVGYYKQLDGSWEYGEMCDTLYVTVN